MTKRVAYKVSKLNEHIKKNLDNTYMGLKIWISGEISNLKIPNGPTSFFTLKDEKSSIDARVFSNLLNSLPFKPENGMEVIVQGEVTFYGKNGRISFAVESMEEKGVGDLHKLFEEMKERLKREGLFDQRFKKELPKYPRKIGVVTSETGAVISDITRTLNRRYPLAKIELYPAVVQGKNAASSISKGIDLFNKRASVDVLIVGRGGGSLEELWGFNEEVVARAIFASKIPVISAVGHDSDITIANFVADVVASTPTAAAELATPYSVTELKNKVLKSNKEILSYGTQLIEKRNSKKTELHRNIVLMHPRNKLKQMKNENSRLTEKMRTLVKTGFNQRKIEVEYLKKGINQEEQLEKIKTLKKDKDNRVKNLQDKINNIIKNKENIFNEKIITLDNLSPLKTMARGYSLVYKDDKIIKNISLIKKEDEITIKIQKGHFKAIVKEVVREKEEKDSD